ncbi:hypothetical protein M8R20_15015 [Pseudomonas sp. R2.Fl]|nr:hypothetical protein [Pseudomonas sp. R2.Fl]
MSSEFYLTNLSRNLVRVGTFGYRENVALRLLPGTAGEAPRQHEPRHEHRPVITFQAVRATGRTAASPPAEVFGRSRLRRLAAPAARAPGEQGP